MWPFFSSCVIQVHLLLELLVAAFAISLLSKQNSSGIISESRHQLVSRWIIDFVYIWVSDKFAYSDPRQQSFLRFAYPRLKISEWVNFSKIKCGNSKRQNIYRNESIRISLNKKTWVCFRDLNTVLGKLSTFYAQWDKHIVVSIIRLNTITIIFITRTEKEASFVCLRIW